MPTLKFKTNIKCGSCIAAVTPFLNELTQIESWKVDTETPDKVLSIDAEEALNPKEVINALDRAGYQAEKI
ncbi:heavy-metal-associated domain-containing protein [Pedobacter metabolipauper]|uniref:Copper chaperone CopZ n=1 Tax=Pedobacter metabolipauper TaxID=425513 RepID=A0A4R6T0T5_9SPHI|nr:heavy metal-associated domain-containing protein [Pedobacter metabolipauper]TDQ12052.1 copper chaperone CopZ [Pedobacter metabolipauper]